MLWPILSLHYVHRNSAATSKEENFVHSEETSYVYMPWHLMLLEAEDVRPLANIHDGAGDTTGGCACLSSSYHLCLHTKAADAMGGHGCMSSLSATSTGGWKVMLLLSTQLDTQNTEKCVMIMFQLIICASDSEENTSPSASYTGDEAMLTKLNCIAPGLGKPYSARGVMETSAAVSGWLQCSCVCTWAELG